LKARSSAAVYCTGVIQTDTSLANSEEQRPMSANETPYKLTGRWKCKGSLIAVIIVSCAVGSLVTARLYGASTADADRVYELRVYYAVPGKVHVLEAHFRDAASLLAKHDLNVIGYWVPNDKPAWDNTFVWIVAHRNREEAKKNWKSFHDDPAFQKYIQSERAEKLIEKVSSTYMRPTDYSALK
jgi:NIPSNAP